MVVANDIDLAVTAHHVQLEVTTAWPGANTNKHREGQCCPGTCKMPPSLGPVIDTPPAETDSTFPI